MWYEPSRDDHDQTTSVWQFFTVVCHQSRALREAREIDFHFSLTFFTRAPPCGQLACGTCGGERCYRRGRNGWTRNECCVNDVLKHKGSCSELGATAPCVIEGEPSHCREHPSENRVHSLMSRVPVWGRLACARVCLVLDRQAVRSLFVYSYHEWQTMRIFECECLASSRMRQSPLAPDHNIFPPLPFVHLTPRALPKTATQIQRRWRPHLRLPLSRHPRPRFTQRPRPHPRPHPRLHASRHLSQRPRQLPSPRFTPRPRQLVSQRPRLRPTPRRRPHFTPPPCPRKGQPLSPRPSPHLSPPLK